MMTIHKQTLEVKDFQIIEIPKGSKILCVQTQNETPVIWYYVPNHYDSPFDRECIVVYIFGTGDDMGRVSDKAVKYVGTFQLYNGAFICHVFVKMESDEQGVFV